MGNSLEYLNKNIPGDLEKGKPLSTIKPIRHSNTMILNQEMINDLVEYPLREACAMLYDKNIKTLSSSANQEDIADGNVYIDIDFDSLSDDNKEIAEKIGEIRKTRNSKIVRLNVPIRNNPSISDIKNKTQQLIDQFSWQAMTWAPTYTIYDLQKIHGLASNDSNYNDPKIWEKDYYYDEEERKFYLSKDHYLKTKIQR